MVQSRRWVVVAVVVLAICWQVAQCTPSPAEQQAAPPFEQVQQQREDLIPAGGYGEGVGAEGVDAEGVGAEGVGAEGVDAEGRSCGTCGGGVSTLHAAPEFELPNIFGHLQDAKLLTLIGLAIPILVLQIITLSIVAYLLKTVKYEDDTGTGSGTGGYYAAFPTQSVGGGYTDSYSSYRSLVPSEDTMSWVLEKLSSAVDLYHDYQDHHNAI